MTNVLLTGASGFVGKAIYEHLKSKPDHSCTRVIRRKNKIEATQSYIVDSIDNETCWDGAFESIDIVIHAAAKVHDMTPDSELNVNRYHQVNTLGTLRMAQHAADSNVKRFIFISSIKVNGESTEKGLPFTEQTTDIPTDFYGKSKFDAEVGLRKIASNSSMEVVIVRPPLVYGPGVKANFLTMMNFVSKGIPLPLGAIDNRRSLVSLENMVDFIGVCLGHPHAANETFLVSDDHDISTAQLLKALSTAFGKSNRLIPVPIGLLALLFKLVGKADMTARLCASLQVDISKAKKLLSWSPPQTLEQGIFKVVEHYRAEKRS